MKQSTPPSAFARGCAIISWFAPILALVCAGVLITSVDKERATTGQTGMMILGPIILFLLVGGLVCGIIVLATARGPESDGVLVQGIIGTVISGILLISVVIIPIRQKNAARNKAALASLAQIKESARKVQITSTNDLNDPERANKNIEQFQDTLDSAATNLTGDSALAIKATSNYLKEFTRRKMEYDAAAGDLKTAKPMSAYGVTNLKQLEERANIVRTFVNKNDELESYVEHAAQHLEEELNKLNVSAATRQATMQGFHKKADLINPIVVQIRKEDDKLGEAILGMVKLEQDNWGHWNVPSAGGKITFQNSGAAKQYNDFVKQVRDAGQRESELQNKLIEISKIAG